jgi:hypothetical protein
MFTTGAVPTHGEKLLFAMNWIFMTEDSAEFLITFWTVMMVTILVGFSTNGVHEGVRGYRVDKIALGAFPCYGYPFAFSFNGLVGVESYSFATTLWTFFPHAVSPPE